MSTLLIFSDFSFLTLFTPLFFFIFHKNSPLFTLAVRESQVRILTISSVFGGKKTKLTPSPAPITVLFYFTISSSLSSRITHQFSYTLLVYPQFPMTISHPFSFILFPLQPFLSHSPEPNGRRNDFFYYLLSAYLFSLYR